MSETIEMSVKSASILWEKGNKDVEKIRGLFCNEAKIVGFIIFRLIKAIQTFHSHIYRANQ